jgi:hypothetical protein
MTMKNERKKKKKKFGFKKLLILGLCNLTSGIVFGVGCLVAEHIDSNWWQSKEVSPQGTNTSRLD